MERKKLKILEELLGRYRRVGNEYLFFCPFCKHHKTKLSVNLDKGVKCWVCGWASPRIYRLVNRLGTRQQKEDWKDLDGAVEIADFSLDLFKEKEREPEPTIKLPEEFRSLANKNLPRSAIFPLKYLRDRGITKEDILYWKIGYCTAGEYKDRIIIPSFNNDGYVNYFIARTYTNAWPKYKNPPVSRDIVFNELSIDWGDKIILVEGAFDAIKAGPNSVPLLGSSLREKSKLFQALAKHDPPVFVAMDKDAKKKARHMCYRLLEYGIELYKIDIEQYNDVGEMTREEFLTLRNLATPLNSDLELFTQALREQGTR